MTARARRAGFAVALGLLAAATAPALAERQSDGAHRSTARAAAQDHGVTLTWNGAAWVETGPTRPSLFDAAEGSGEVVLYWNGTAWAVLPDGFWPRYSHRTDSAGERAVPDLVAASPSASEAGSGRSRPEPPARSSSAGHAAAPSVSSSESHAAPTGETSRGGGSTGGGLPATPAATDASGGTASSSSAASAGSSPAASAAVSFVGHLHTGGTTTMLFSTQTLRDLTISVQWSNLPPTPSTQRLDLIAPDGSVYQSRSAAIDAFTMQTRVPVGGTWITQHGLHGTWRAQVFLVGSASPVTDASFTLGQ